MSVVVVQYLLAPNIVFHFDGAEFDVLICKDVKMDKISMAEYVGDLLKAVIVYAGNVDVFLKVEIVFRGRCDKPAGMFRPAIDRIGEGDSHAGWIVFCDHHDIHTQDVPNDVWPSNDTAPPLEQQSCFMINY